MYNYWVIVLYFSHLSIQVKYAIPFVFYLLPIIIKNKSHFTLNSWLFGAICVVSMSFFFGLAHDWYFKDVIADVARYLAPFIGFAAGITIFKNYHYRSFFKMIFCIAWIELCFFIYSIINKTMHTMQGSPILDYAENTLFVDTLLFFFFFNLLKNGMLSRSGRVFAILYSVGYIVTPILTMSKGGTITMVLSITLLLFFCTNLKQKIIFLILLSFASSIFVTATDVDKAFRRFGDLTNLLQTGNYFDDASSSVRIVEVTNIVSQLQDYFPAYLPLGKGAGALYFETVAKIRGGIKAENYRENGGLHHIFTVYFGYLFRYGVIGLFFHLLWIYYVYQRLRKSRKRCRKDLLFDSFRISVILYIVINLVADIFVPVFIYGNPLFGFYLAMGYYVTASDGLTFIKIPTQVEYASEEN
jgi:hypothetical protein